MPRHYKDVPQNEKIFIVMASVVLLFLAFGCEGTSPSTSIPAKYVGDYTGTWIVDIPDTPTIANEQHGGWTMTVHDSGVSYIFLHLGMVTHPALFLEGLIARVFLQHQTEKQL